MLWSRNTKSLLFRNWFRERVSRERYFQWLYIAVLCFLALLLARCSNKEEFTAPSKTQFFTQDYRPEKLDILWVIDDRSPMFRVRDHLIAQATQFFKRLDSIPAYYRMAFITADMQFSKGALKPAGNPVILTKDLGSLDERAAQFSAVISQVIINMSTGASDQGLAAAEAALKSSFVPQEDIPLVITFVSDSDDSSPQALQYYESVFLEIKKGHKELVKIYSVNYAETGTRCATEANADIDKGTFQDRYFQLAQNLGGVTADLCEPFANKIDLNGLSFGSPKMRFKLDQKPNKNSIIVKVSIGDKAFETKWKFDEQTNEIVFEIAPPEGSTIEVNYQL
ncbi:MAG: hypothetical protein HY537_10410 [Deltaproteobacteria bacterium]|nr:hypothetical protein [Deltaproteobacteria bacterium]